MRDIHPRFYALYSFFFLCQGLSLEVLLDFFSEHDLDNFVQNGLIVQNNGQLISNYRFVPIDDFVIISSPRREVNTPNYVHIGGDTLVFWDHLKNECRETVNDVLEIGCGAGFLSLAMSQFAQSITATDISQRALDFTNLSAKINGITNIVTRNSDVYSNIDGKFDLIISNPPYMFLPKEYSKRVYSYGGFLGVEILKEILFGLDDYLKDDGVALILANSYIRDDGSNTLYEIIKSLFYEKAYSITLKQLDYQTRAEHATFYQEHRISHSVRYLVKIRKAATPELSHLPIRGSRRLFENLKTKMLSNVKVYG
jgi:HemK-related putative methylase